MQLRGTMIDQEANSLMNDFGINGMVVIENKDQGFLGRRNVVDEAGQNRCGRWWLWRSQESKRIFSSFRSSRPDRTEDVRPEE